MTLLDLSKLKVGNKFKYLGEVLTINLIDFIHDNENKWLHIGVELNNLRICSFSFGYPDLSLKLKDFELV